MVITSEEAPAQRASLPAPEARRARRRGPELERAILDAAWGEITAVGYDRATMDGVAERAGTNKAALYRRWPNRTELLASAIDRHVTGLGAAPSPSGDFRTDAIAVLETMRGRCQGLRIVPDATGGLAAQVRSRAAWEAFNRMAELLDAAAGRRDIDVGLTPLIARFPVDVLYAELALGDDVRRELVIDIVDRLLLPLVRGLSRSLSNGPTAG